MTKLANRCSTPSRRGVLKAAAALATGIATPAVLTIRPAFAAYPDGR